MSKIEWSTLSYSQFILFSSPALWPLGVARVKIWILNHESRWSETNAAPSAPWLLYNLNEKRFSARIFNITRMWQDDITRTDFRQYRSDSRQSRSDSRQFHGNYEVGYGSCHILLLSNIIGPVYILEPMYNLYTTSMAENGS